MSEWDAISAPADDWDAVSEVAPVEVVGKRKKKRGWMDEVTGAMANVNRGLGIGDELAAAGGVVTGVLTGRHKLTDPVGPAYKAELAAQRGREDEFAAERPRVAAVARGTGNALTMAAPIGPGAQAFAAPLTVMGRTVAPRVANALRGATVAGLTGAGYAAADRGSPQERVAAASRASTDPLTLALGAGGGAMATPRAKPTQTEAPPSLEELQGRRTAAYDDVAASGHTYSPEEVQTLAQSVVDDLASVQINPARHPRAASMMEDISGLAAEGEPLTLTQLDQLRQVVRRDVANSPDQAEAFMGKRIIAQIDDFLDGTAGGEMIGGARELNTRVRKLESLDELTNSAELRAAGTGSGGNIDNATRQNVNRFMQNTRNLTPQEREAADALVRGSRGQNALRQVGKLSPQGNGLMTALSIGGTMANPALGVPVLGGAVSKVVADAVTARNLQQLRALIAQGGDAAQEVSRALADPAYAELRQQLANDLSAQAGVQGASAAAAR